MILGSVGGTVLPVLIARDFHLQVLIVRDLPLRALPIYLYVGIADATLLMIYLSWPSLQRWLGRAFLPLALIIATVGPILEQSLGLRERLALISGSALVGAWQLLPILFIPLVLIAWQYNFRAVLLYCLATALLDWGLTLWAFNPPDLRLLPLIGAILIRTISFIVVGYMVARLMANQRQQRRALAEANAQLSYHASTLEQLATSRERNRLARELHDTLAHSLSGVAVQLEAVKTLWKDSPDEAQAMLERSLATTRSGLTETRRALQALRASPLEDLGLAIAMRNLAESVASRHGLSLDLEIPNHLENLSPDLEQSVYRIAQEALENIASHAKAHNVKVQLMQENGRLELAISDDGRGFEPSKVGQADQFGLQGIRERSEEMGGNLTIESRPGGGTTIRLAWGLAS